MVNILVISALVLVMNIALNVFFYKNKEKYNKNLYTPNNISVFSIFVSIILFIIFTNLNQDMIIDFNLPEVIFITLSLPALLLVSYKYYNDEISKKNYSLITILFCLILTSIMPNQNIILNEMHNIWLDKIVIFLLLNISTYILIYNDSYRLIQNITYFTISLGIFIAFMLNAIGLLIGAISIAILSNIFISYLFSGKREIDEYKNKTFNLPIAILISWVFVRIAGEELWSFPLALSSYQIISFIFAILSASLNFDKFWRNNNYNIPNFLSKNSVDYNGIVQNQLRTALFVLIFSIGAIYSSKPTGFLTIITVFIIWSSYKTANWQEKEKTFKEINKDFVSQLKENLTSTKEALDNITEKDD